MPEGVAPKIGVYKRVTCSCAREVGQFWVVVCCEDGQFKPTHFCDGKSLDSTFGGCVELGADLFG